MTASKNQHAWSLIWWIGHDWTYILLLLPNDTLSGKIEYMACPMITYYPLSIAIQWSLHTLPASYYSCIVVRQYWHWLLQWWEDTTSKPYNCIKFIDEAIIDISQWHYCLALISKQLLLLLPTTVLKSANLLHLSLTLHHHIHQRSPVGHINLVISFGLKYSMNLQRV